MAGPEKKLDEKFVAYVTRLGGTTIKLSTLGRYGSGGWPDRMCLFPGRVVVFVELKAPGKEPTALQHQRLEFLQDIGFDAGWFDDLHEACVFVNRILAVRRAG